MRASSSRYGTLVGDAQHNREHPAHPIEMPVLVLNGESGLPQAQLRAGAQQVATHVETDTMPAAGHTLGTDNPGWLAKRLIAF